MTKLTNYEFENYLKKLFGETKAEAKKHFNDLPRDERARILEEAEAAPDIPPVAMQQASQAYDKLDGVRFDVVIMEGDEAYFVPFADLTREEAASIVYRLNCKLREPARVLGVHYEMRPTTSARRSP